MKQDRTNPAGLDPAQAGDFPAAELFLAASTAVLLVRESTGYIVIANPAALALLGLDSAQLVGGDWRAAFDAATAVELAAAGQRAASTGAGTQVAVRAMANAAPLVANLSHFRVAREAYFLIRLSADTGSGPPAVELPVALIEQLDATSAPFVVTDGALCIEFANRAFCTLVGELERSSVDRQSVLRWLNFGTSDLALLHQQMSQREATATITTTLCAGPTSLATVDVTAIAVADRSCPRWGFILGARAAGTAE